MSLGDELLKKVNKKFEPSTNVDLKFRSYDILLVTDKLGNAVKLFIGKADGKGIIKGERYVRTLKYDKMGVLIKDHWENKGKAL
jgi:hypothetical protein